MNAGSLKATGAPYAEKLRAALGERVREIRAGATDIIVIVDAAAWSVAHLHLRREGFDMLMSLAAVDRIADKQMDVVTHLYASEIKHRISIKTAINRDRPELPSLASVWPAADWHERECFDLSGVVFTGHPNLKRILCSEDWIGHALRKDYEQPKYVHGIPNTLDVIDIAHQEKRVF